MRRKPAARAVHGILLLDKPQGITSNRALQRVKHLFNAQKAGHTGSLDPMATGMLPICLGEATKVSGYLLDAPKRYYFTAKLGVVTDTGDADGQMIRQCDVPSLEATAVTAVLNRFLGSIQQIPPMYSALHHEGERLYDLARQGRTVERAPRTVEIHALELKALGADTFSAEVACSKGTYIRTLAEDIGQALGCGAHLIELRRLSVSGFATENMVTWARLEALASEGPAALDAYLMPVDAALQGWPVIELDREAAAALCHGQRVSMTQPLAPGSQLALYGPGRAFLGIGAVLPDGRVAPRRLMQ